MKLKEFLQDGMRQVREIWSHPLHRAPARRAAAFLRLLRWQLAGRFHNPAFVAQITPRLRMKLRRGLVSREIYLTGLHEFDDLVFVAHALRPGDQLLDVGANAGIYSLFAASESRARCHAYEPVSEIAAILEENIQLNGLQELVHVHCHAVGSKKGVIRLSAGDGLTTHQVGGSQAGLEARLERLDDLFERADSFTLLKIDVEGLEVDVLAGAKKLLRDRLLGAVLVETGGLGARYGHSLDELHSLLVDAGFSPARYDAFTRTLSPREGIANAGNTIYVRDAVAMGRRCNAAPLVRLQHHEV